MANRNKLTHHFHRHLSYNEVYFVSDKLLRIKTKLSLIHTKPSLWSVLHLLARNKITREETNAARASASEQHCVFIKLSISLLRMHHYSLTCFPGNSKQEDWEVSKNTYYSATSWSILRLKLLQGFLMIKGIFRFFSHDIFVNRTYKDRVPWWRAAEGELCSQLFCHYHLNMKNQL